MLEPKVIMVSSPSGNYYLDNLRNQIIMSDVVSWTDINGEVNPR